MDDYPLISSPQNPRLKGVVSLRDARARRKEKLFLIDGIDLIRKAIQIGFSIQQLYLQESVFTNSAIVDFAKLGCEIFFLSPTAMAKIQYGERKLDAIAVAQFGDTTLGSLENRITRRNDPAHKSKTILVLDRMEKPGNLGAALRTADAARVQAVLLSDPICDLWNPNAIRSSLGALFTVPVATGTEHEIANWLQSRNSTVFTARVEGSVCYTEANFNIEHAIVIGNEAEGLRDRWIHKSYQPISIPMLGTIDSLNASVSTAILTYESLRQQQTTAK